MASTTTYTTTIPVSEPSEFILPDLVANCHYPLRVNTHCHSVSCASEQWFLERTRLVEPKVAKFMGLRAGELAAVCYPDVDASHLRVVSDYLNWLFYTDDWMDEFGADSTREMRECCISAYRDPINFQENKISGTLCKSYFERFKQTAGPGCTERFILTMDLFFTAVAKQSDDRVNGRIPDLESYITMRRDTSGCKPCFALIEYAARIDLPDEVISHPTIKAMEEASNDYITWSNDTLSYNVEQSRHDTHNMVVAIMREQGLDLQGAVDYIGHLCDGCIQRFEDNRAILPSWGEELDRQVATYVLGLQDWIIGALHWSFDTTRHFGKEGHNVKRERIVKLLPKTPL